MAEGDEREVKERTVDALDAMLEHTTALTKLTLELAESARQAREQEAADVWEKAQKEVLSTFYGEAQKYTTVVIAGGYAAFYAALSILGSRFTDWQLSFATLWITISLGVFVLWEVVSMAEVSLRTLFKSLEKIESSRLRQIGWATAMLGSLGTALLALGMLVYVCVKHLV